MFSGSSYEYELIKEQWLASVEQIAKRGVFVGGPPVASFENAYAAYIGSKHGIGVGNGTDALILTLKALGVGPGDEVITVANTFIATVEAIHHTGAVPVLVDCDPDTFLIDLEQVKARVTERTKAVIAVHLYGQMVDLESFAAWAEERNIHVIEDSAQAAGAVLRGKKAGSLGTAGCFSFYPDKNLGALGDGGGVTTSNDDLAVRIKQLRNHGGEIKYQHEVPGFNSRLDPIQAAALELKLAYLDEWSAIRRNIAAMYEHYLGDCTSIRLPSSRGDESHVFHLYVVRIDGDGRERVRKQLQKQGVLTAIQYPEPIHLTKAFSHLNCAQGDFPNAEQAAGEILSLPMNITVKEEEVAGIAGIITGCLGTIGV
nr:DegT/DnrJ/EryC1/StrS family aminotransferase [Paenibacillus oenotherae]